MEIPELVRTLLASRGVTREEDVAAFLAPDYALHTHDPFLLSGMDVAVERLLGALDRGEHIAIYADFDSDGIPGAALLWDLFQSIDYDKVEVYLPHRDREGYGFHAEAIEALAARGVSLIITVDVGTTAVDAVRFARERGVDVIVTDHHEIQDRLPEAVAVLNPKLPPYPFPHLCGAAVAYKLAQATLRAGKARGAERFMRVRDGWEKWLLDLVAIATVADMVPLVGENRALAHWGLHVLRRSRRAGIDALCAALRVRKRELTEDDIGFSIAPRVNAASRMDDPDLAFALLTTSDALEARRIASQLEVLNAKRKGAVASVVRQVRKLVRERFTDADRVIVLGDTGWKPALLGLAANSIMNERGGVVCLWGRDARDRLKGSCRSDGSVSVVELLAAAGEALEAYGGHRASGGFSVSHEHVHELQAALTRVVAPSETVASEVAAPEYDARLSLPELSRALFQQVTLLSPFGTGNPKPVFFVPSAIVTSVQRFGKEKNHVELLLECRVSGVRYRAFDFFRAPEDLSHVPVQGAEVGLLATLERDTYRGGLALRLIDVLSRE